MPAGSQIHKQVIVKELNAGALTVDPPLRLYFVTVPPADLATPRGDFERLAADDGQVTVALRDGRRVVAIWPELCT